VRDKTALWYCGVNGRPLARTRVRARFLARRLGQRLVRRPLARTRVRARYGVPKTPICPFCRVRKLRPDVRFC